jgi:hypothetical protein
MRLTGGSSGALAKLYETGLQMSTWNLERGLLPDFAAGGTA